MMDYTIALVVIVILVPVLLDVFSPAAWMELREAVLPILVTAGVVGSFVGMFLLTDSFIVAIITAAIVLVAYKYFDADRLFGWMYGGRHYPTNRYARTRRKPPRSSPGLSHGRISTTREWQLFFSTWASWTSDAGG